jgi:hypothetical protein
MSEGSVVVTSAEVAPESFPHSAIANAEPWPRPAQAWYPVFIFSLSLLVNMLDAMGRRLHCVNLLQ